MKWLDRLRDATREAHEALHRHPLLVPLSGEGLTHARLATILQAFELYYRTAEAAITVSVPPSIPHAPVRDWLRQDMATFNIAPVAANLTVPPIDTVSRLIGYLYTKQGSTLGGRVISKHIERNLSLQPLIGQRFFAGYGPDNGAQWKLFVEQANTHADELDLSQTVIAAIAAFDGIRSVCDLAAKLEFAYRLAFLEPPLISGEDVTQ